YERYIQFDRLLGPYAGAYWVTLSCNVFIPQVLWFPRVRHNNPLLFLVALVVLLGMWMERFVIVITSLHRDYLPSSWGRYAPTGWDYAALFGSIGLFFLLFLLFIRFLPMISIAELRELLPRSEGGRAGESME